MQALLPKERIATVRIFFLPLSLTSPEVLYSHAMVLVKARQEYNQLWPRLIFHSIQPHNYLHQHV